MAPLIQKLSSPLSEKIKKVISPTDRIYFCVEGIPGNALIGTEKFLIAVITGSYKGSISYTYDYDQITNIHIFPPLHGDHLTVFIEARDEQAELKPKLYFFSNQKNILKQILSKISSLSNTYSYIEPIKEASAHHRDVQLIVEMKKALGEIYREIVSPDENVIICLSVGEHQGLVVTEERVLIFKINVEEDDYKIGEFPLEEIQDIKYSVGFVTGQFQVITPNVPIIRQRMREKELIDVESIICFSKKDYGGIIEIVLKKLRKLIAEIKNKNSKLRLKSELVQVKDIIEEERNLEDQRQPEGFEEKEFYTLDDINSDITDSGRKTKRLTLEDLEDIEDKKKPLKQINTRRLSQEDIDAVETTSRKTTREMTDPPEFKEPVKIPQRATSLSSKEEPNEELAHRLSREVLEEMKDDEQLPFYSRSMINQFSKEIVQNTFPHLLKSSLPDLITDKIMKHISRLTSKTSSGAQRITGKISPVEIQYTSSGTRVNEAIPATTFKPKEKNPNLENKLTNFTSLTAICAALIIEKNKGNILYSSVKEGENYDNATLTVTNFYYSIKGLHKNLLKNVSPQWIIEYTGGLIYIEELTPNYLLMIVGKENSSFGTLKIFIEQNRQELINQLVY